MPGQVIQLAVHGSHEAHVKLGGIGAVLDGILGSASYNANVERTILAGPLNVYDSAEMERMTAPGNRLTILYSSIHSINQVEQALAAALRAIEEEMHVRLLYGRRAFGAYEHEVVLVDALSVRAETASLYKYRLWERWRLPSNRYEGDWEFRYHLDAAEPLFAAIEALCPSAAGAGRRDLIVAHEWVGLPLVFSALLHAPGKYGTLFYAHEVATARQLIESDPGHDTRFYNVLAASLDRGLELGDVFGDRSWFYKHAMLQLAGACQGILAVGDRVADELRFLGGAVARSPISLVYNGVASPAISLAQKLESRGRLQQYATDLLGYRPDYVFTHVGRMVLSKAFWRDYRVLDHLDRSLAWEGKRAVLFTVATSDPNGHLPDDVWRWEREYGWPVGHRGDNGDLRGEELRHFFDVQEPFNARSRSIRGVLVNQYGWSRERCGRRMPAGMQFSDLRWGTDLEFGLSIYEPFGISQIEPLCAGALSAVSSVCGSLGLAETAAGAEAARNLVVGDFVALPYDWSSRTPWDALWIDRRVRDIVEAREGHRVSQLLAERLPRSQAEMHHLLREGQRVSAGLSWEIIVGDYLLPALARILA